MIIKTIKGHKSKQPKRILALLNYLLDEEKTSSPIDGRDCFSKQFLRGYDRATWVSQILQCDAEKSYNNHMRRVIVRHEVCSFASESREYLLQNRSVLKDIQREYIKRRSQAPGISVVHYESDHIHIHYAFCATNIDSTSNRLNNQQFRAFKNEMEELQRTRYPELHHSEIQHGKKKAVPGPKHMKKSK